MNKPFDNKSGNILLVLSAIFCLTVFHQITVGQNPKLMVQTGHLEWVESVVFSPNGEILASGGADSTIKIWNAKTGQEINNFIGHSSTVNSLVFSLDGETLISGSQDHTIKLWSVKTGKEIDTLRGHTEGVSSIALSPDGKMLVSSSSDETVKVWNLTTRRVIETLRGHLRSVNDAAFSPDGKMIASASGDRTIKLWNTATFQEITTLRGHTKLISSVVFSPDSRILASQSYPLEDKTRFWDVAEGKEIEPPVEAPVSSWFSRNWSLMASPGEEDYEIKITDVDSKKVINTFSTAPQSVRVAVFSPDNKTIACLSSNSATFNLWNIETGSLIATFVGIVESIHSIRISPDGEMLSTERGMMDSNILWNISPDVKIKPFGDNSAAFSHDGNLIASELNEGTIKLWNKRTGRELNPIETGEWVDKIAFSSDGKMLAYDSGEKIEILDLRTRRKIKTLNGHAKSINSFDFSPDAKLIASGSGDKSVRLWDVNTGQEIKNFASHSDEVNSVAFSSDNKTLASGSNDNTVKLWNTITKEEIETLDGHSGSVNSVAFSKDGKLLASGGSDAAIRLWDMKTLQEVKTLRGHVGSVTSIEFYPGGKILISGSSDGTVKFWDVLTGKELASLISIGDEDWVTVTPEGFFDGTPAGWKQLLWQFGGNIFDYGSVELYFNEFFRPNILQEIFTGKLPKSNVDIGLIDRRQPKINLVSIDCKCKPGEQRDENQKITVEIEITDNNEKKKRPEHRETSGAQDLRLFRNDSLVKVWHGDIFDEASGCKPVPVERGEPRRARCKTEISVVAGENPLMAYAFNMSNVKSEDFTGTIEDKLSAKKAGTLYILGIGVNKYANSNYDLNFAVSDVEEIGAALKAEQNKLAQDSQLKQFAKTEIITLKDELATKNNILLSLQRFSKDDSTAALPDDLCAELAENLCSELKNELLKIKPTEPEDALLIQFSGHGVSRGQRFYLLPHNFTNAGQLAQQGVSDEELNRYLENVDVGRLLMIIDACQSGQALGEKSEGRAPMNSKGLAQLAYDKGMMILAAAQSRQAALEAVRIGGKQIKHGLLTYALLDAMQNPQAKADRDENQQLWEREWFDFAVEQVPLFQTAAMKQRRIDLETGAPEVTGKRDIIYLTDDDPNLDPEKRHVQTPRVFYRRETEVKPLIIARP